MSGPLHRIQTIEGSLRCFAFGLMSLVPILGVPASLITFHEFARTRSQTSADWNPAHPYLIAGYVMAWFGFAVTGALAVLVGSIVVRVLLG